MITKIDDWLLDKMKVFLDFINDWLGISQKEFDKYAICLGFGSDLAQNLFFHHKYYASLLIFMFLIFLTMTLLPRAITSEDRFVALLRWMSIVRLLDGIACFWHLCTMIGFSLMGIDGGHHTAGFVDVLAAIGMGLLVFSLSIDMSNQGKRGKKLADKIEDVFSRLPTWSHAEGNC